MYSQRTFSDQNPQILLIEEETEVLQSLAATLTTAGYSTRCCTTASEACAAAREVRPDMIICDVVVHEFGGLEICEQIKRETEAEEMLVMFLSTNQIPDIIRRRGPFGGSYYLHKPFDPDVLLDLLDKTLNSTRQLAMSVQ
jgi:DNA-binding response OmpR family regulator